MTRAQEDAAGCSEVPASQVPAPILETEPIEPASVVAPETTAENVEAVALVTCVTSEPVCPIIPSPSVVEAAHQSGHVIRLHVKSINCYS